MYREHAKSLFLMAVALGICLLSFAYDCWAENIAGQSVVSKVTVYPGSARVTRQVDVELSVGEHSIVLDQIVPPFDENSLTVSGKGTANVKIFGAYIKHLHSQKEADQRVQELIDLIELLSDDIQMANNKLEVARKEAEYLDSVKLYAGKQIPQDLVTQMPSMEQLGQVQTFLTDGYAQIEEKKEELRLNIRDLTREREVAQRKLNELRSFGGQQQRQLIVDVQCAKSGKLTLDVSYLVHGAYWQAIYDARADYKVSEVELTSFAKIKQTTGEDWNDVELTLSTAQPTVSGRMPYVSPWILNAYQPRPAARMKMGNMMMAEESLRDDQGQTAEYMGTVGSSPEAKPMEETDANFAYSQVEQKGVSIVYKIARPATIKSDGTESKYPINTQTLKADFEYSTYPRLKPFAYLGSRVMNAPDVQLLAGQVNLFLNDDYVGKSNIDNIGPGEEFNLYLGVDENVKVKREQIEKKMDDVLLGGIKAPNRKTTFMYKLTVENYKDKKITVNLFEAIPVSQDERIKVKVFDASRKATDTDWEDRQGIWRWKFELNPKAKQEITYSFTVDHPRDMTIPGI